MTWLLGLKTQLSNFGKACLTPAGFTMCCDGVLGLLAAIIVAAIAGDIFRMKDAYERLEAAGVIMRMDRRDYPSIMAGPRVSCITFDASNLTAELLESAACLPNVSEVAVENADVSDQLGSQLLVSFPRMKRLFFLHSRLDNEVLESLSRCRHLYFIGISRGRLTQRQAIAISQSASITDVNLCRTQLDNGALSQLWKKIELTTLSLHTATFDQREFEGIRCATKLESLNITNTGFGDECRPHLAACRSLTSISLGHQQLTDKTVEELRSNPALRVHVAPE